jgi:hypothetical protein
MLARSVYHICVMTWVAALGCSGTDEPRPSVTLSIHGQVFTAGPAPAAVAGAAVALRHFKGLLDNPETLAETTTDQAGNYQITYTFTSACEPQDNTTDWMEASAEGHGTATSYTAEAGQFSDPPIHCTSDPQTINLALQPVSAD